MPQLSTNSPEAKIEPGHPFFEIIEEAYRVFDNPKPKHTGVCKHCCMDNKIEDDFFNPPIRELPLHYIRDWYEGACDPNGVPKETWAYLLPRVLEILALGEEVSRTAIEVSLSRFDTGNTENWSVEEWKVLDNFEKMYLRREIEPRESCLDDVICMFRLAGWPLVDLINQVTLSSDEELAQRLWRDWCRWVVPGREDVWITSFWQDADNTTMFNFYTSRDLHDRMEVLALSGDTEAQLAERAFAVASVIEAKAI